MGGNVSTVLNEEKSKPLDITDIDTPRGESAKAEVRRLRALLAKHRDAPPSLSEYLSELFKQADKDNSGHTGGKGW